MKFKIAITSFLFVMSSQVLSYTENNKAVTRIGVQGHNAFFAVSNGLSQDCKFGVIYLNITTDFGKAAYSNLLTAKASKTALRRLDYDQVSSGEICTLTLVEMAE